MGRYRKIPIIVEAVQFTRQNQEKCKQFTQGKLRDIKIPRSIDGIMTGTVDTLEGEYTATENDYIIKGIKGEFYPCKPDIFHKAYEKLTETERLFEGLGKLNNAISNPISRG